jgi:putative polyketide hydroxylase
VVLEPAEDHPLHAHPREARGRPGSRAPHLFLERAGSRVSSLDLFGLNFVLLAAPAGAAWRHGARVAADELGVPLDVYVVDGEELRDPDGRFPDAYGITAAGAVLVRPDGVIAWRGSDGTGASEATMREVLTTLLCRTDEGGR